MGSIAITVISAVLVFGFLILIHELGHYLFARLFKVTINEFSIGMGPKLLYRDSKRTGIRYSLSAFPIGGYVAMAGEDDESDDPNSFDKKPAWQRFIITVAGASVNIIAGFLAMIILTSVMNVGSTTVHSFYEDDELGYECTSPYYGLKEGDVIIKVGGKRVSMLDELAYEIMRQGIEPLDVVVLRDGEEVLLPDVQFPVTEQSGQSMGNMDFRVKAIRKNFGSVMNYSFRKSVLIVRMCWESIFDLITGRYTMAAVSGPVGISTAIGSAAQNGFPYLLNITALISINLGVMNLLPIPALDGGRLVTILIEMVTRKRIPRKVEIAINTAGLMLLLVLMLVVTAKDIIQLII